MPVAYDIDKTVLLHLGHLNNISCAARLFTSRVPRLMYWMAYVIAN